MGIGMEFIQSVDAGSCHEGILHQRKALRTLIPLKAASSFSISHCIYNLCIALPRTSCGSMSLMA